MVMSYRHLRRIPHIVLVPSTANSGGTCNVLTIGDSYYFEPTLGAGTRLYPNSPSGADIPIDFMQRKFPVDDQNSLEDRQSRFEKAIWSRPVHDMKLIRENPTAFYASLNGRSIKDIGVSLEYFHETAVQINAYERDAQHLASLQNEMTANIGRLKVTSDVFPEMIEQAALYGEGAADLKRKADLLRGTVEHFLLRLPNALDPTVPHGVDENDNRQISDWLGDYGTATLRRGAKEHFDVNIGLDFESGVKLAGSRFTVLRGGAARLSRALGQFMIDWHIRHNGYEEISAPVMVNRQALIGTGQFPKFVDDVYNVDDDLFLAPTSEVMLTNLVSDTIINASDLPLRYVALSECFRKEAGSAGRDTRGIIRQHQFQKVELVSIVEPDKSTEEHERMTNCAASILKALELPHRIMLLCSGDTGFSARKTYDIEVWMPGAERWREISSCSNCGDFQARRIGARIKLDKKRKVVAHTLNGSGVAVGRALAAIIENHLTDDGRIAIPALLQPYMDGAETIAIS